MPIVVGETATKKLAPAPPESLGAEPAHHYRKAKHKKVSASHESKKKLLTLYKKFKESNNYDENRVKKFIVDTVKILIKFPKRNTIAKAEFRKENKLVRKILFAGVAYIGNPSSTEITHFLVHEAGFSSSEFADLVKIRDEHMKGTSGKVNAAVYVEQKSSSANPYASLISRFLNHI
jgi:hypothetical protein